MVCDCQLVFCLSALIGIGAVGRLVDEEVEVIWADDSSFRVGRMGNFYRNVPANTPNRDLIHGLSLANSLNFNATQEKRSINLSSFGDDDQYQALSYLVDALEDATSQLSHNFFVHTIHGKVVTLFSTDMIHWMFEYEVSNGENKIHDKMIDGIIIATGAIPKVPLLECTQISRPIRSCIFSLDHMVNAKYVNDLFCNQPDLKNVIWSVIGASHSGILVIKNLIEHGVRKVYNIRKHPLRFQEVIQDNAFRLVYVYLVCTLSIYRCNIDDCRYPGTGLKGPVGCWAKTVLPALEQRGTVETIAYDRETTWSEQFSILSSTHIVFAIGYERSGLPSILITPENGDIMKNLELNVSSEIISMPTLLSCISCHKFVKLSESVFDEYDKETGAIISPSIFGTGIAFPQDCIDIEGNRDPLVGVRRTILQTETILRSFRSFRA